MIFNSIFKLFSLLDGCNIVYRRRLYWTQFFVFVSSVFELLGLAIIIPFAQFLLNKDGLFSRLLNYFYFFNEYTVSNFDLFASLFVIVLYSVGTFFSLKAIQYLYSFSHFVGSEISSCIFNRMLTIDYKVFSQLKKPVIIKDITQEVDRLVEAILIPLVQVNSKILTTTFVVIYLLYIEPKLTVCVFSLFFMFYFSIYFLTKRKLNFFGGEISKSNSMRYQYIDTLCSGYKEFKIYNNVNFIESRFRRSANDYAFSRSFSQYLSGSPKYFVELISVVVFIVFISFFRSIGIEVILVLAFSIVKLLPSFQLIYGSVATIRSNIFALTAIENIIHSFSSSSTSAIQPNNSNIFCGLNKESNHVLSMQDIFFSIANKRILSNISFQLAVGNKLAIVGPSGSGKSSLVNIILKLFVPDSGVVCSTDKISLVPQDIFILTGTLKENIILDLEFDDSLFSRVVSLACLDFVSSLKDGFDTVIGDGGVLISGGQKQRVGIARALYRQPKLLIMDEATSALDLITESLVVNGLNSTPGLSIIYIAHRINSIKDCDRIIVLKSGEIIEEGDYSTLSSNKSNYFYKLISNSH